MINKKHTDTQEAKIILTSDICNCKNIFKKEKFNQDNITVFDLGWTVEAIIEKNTFEDNVVKELFVLGDQNFRFHISSEDSTSKKRICKSCKKEIIFDLAVVDNELSFISRKNSCNTYEDFWNEVEVHYISILFALEKAYREAFGKSCDKLDIPMRTVDLEDHFLSIDTDSDFFEKSKFSDIVEDLIKLVEEVK